MIYDILRCMTRKKEIPSAKSRVVLLFVKPMFHSHRERIAGVYSAAIEGGWQIQQIPSEPTASHVASAVNLWNPVGCLVDPSAMSANMDGRAFGDLPVVLMGRGEAKLKWSDFDRSFQDCLTPVEMAYAELSRLKPAGFAFIGDPALPFWSVERGDFFKRIVLRDVPDSAFFEYSGPDPSTMRGRRAMMKWLGTLPRPCGCFLAADHLAASFYAAAQDARLAIGSDLPTVGVDDDERICLSLKPTLTSVHPDFFLSGSNGIKILETRLRNPDLPPQSRLYGALDTTRRASTNPSYRDARVTKGMAFITVNACSKVAVVDVAAEMGCCGRLAESLFHKHTGASILDAIRKTRLEKAFSLLKNPRIPIDAIPFQCGYEASPAYLKTYFKRVTGLTMREWRKINGLHNKKAETPLSARTSSAKPPPSFAG